MVRRLVRLALLPLLLAGTALLGGCYVTPYPVAPRYAYGHPARAYPAPYYYGGGYYRHGYWR